MMVKSVRFILITAVMTGFLSAGLPVYGEVKKPDAGDKVALVNGSPIDKGEFDGEVLRLQRALLSFGKPLTCSQLSTVQTDVLESLIRREIIYQESRKAGVKPDEEAVNKEIKALREQFPSDTEYKNELSRRNISEETLRARLQKNSSIQQYVEKQYSSRVTVTDNEMIAYYEGRLDVFKQPLQVRVSHILVQTDPKWDASRKQEARKKADQVMSKLKKKEDFAAVAREHSDGPTRTNGGDLGYIRTGQLEKQFESKVFLLNTGDTTDIIETETGFHIFKVMDKKPETVLAYEDLKDKIRQFLFEEKAKQEADRQAKTLRDKADVKILLTEDITAAK